MNGDGIAGSRDDRALAAAEGAPNSMNVTL
jgi:hypothetical protein